MAPLVNQIQLAVVPEINRVKLGNTATFDCDAQLSVTDDPIQSFSWVASNLIAKEGRYSFDNNQRTLHVSDIKIYDNDTSVECLVTTDSGSRQAAFGHIVVLPDDTSPLHPRNSTASPTLPPPARNVSGGLTTVSSAGPFDWSTGLIFGVVSCAFLFVILALLVYVWHLKRRNRNRKSLNNDELLTPTITVNNNESSVMYNRDFDNVSVQYAKPQKSRSVSNLSMMSSIFQYDIPRTSSHSPSPDIIPNSSPPSHAKLYKQKRTSHNMPHKGMHHHRSMPSLSVVSRTLSTDGYEDMDSGRLSRASSHISRQYDNLSPNLSSSHNHLGPPSNVGNSQSKSLSQYSNWSVQEPSRAISYENIAGSSKSSFQNSEDFVAYQNQPIQRAPSFEIVDDSEKHRQRLNYASLHLDDGHDSPVPVQNSDDNTTYAKIRGIIRILRTKRSTRVNIVNH